MKKLIAVLAVSVIGVFPAMAAGTIRDNCGCGLGTSAFGDNEPTLVMQLVVTFLNGICANQTFGISSGTSGCEPHAGFASNQRLQEFVAGNMDRLAVDIASGQGSTLDALADLLAVPAAGRSDLYARLQGQFDRIFTSGNVTSTEVVDNLAKVVNG